MLSVRCHPRRRPVGYNVDGVIVMAELSLDAHRLIERFADAPDGLPADGSPEERELYDAGYIMPSKYTDNDDSTLVFIAHVETYSITTDGLKYLAQRPHCKRRNRKIEPGQKTDDSKIDAIIIGILVSVIAGIIVLFVEYFIIMRLAH